MAKAEFNPPSMVITKYTFPQKVPCSVFDHMELWWGRVPLVWIWRSHSSWEQRNTRMLNSWSVKRTDGCKNLILRHWSPPTAADSSVPRKRHWGPFKKGQINLNSNQNSAHVHTLKSASTLGWSNNSKLLFIEHLGTILRQDHERVPKLTTSISYLKALTQYVSMKYKESFIHKPNPSFSRHVLSPANHLKGQRGASRVTD